MIELVIHQRRRDLGGFEVGRVYQAGSGLMAGASHREAPRLSSWPLVHSASPL